MKVFLTILVLLLVPAIASATNFVTTANGLTVTFQGGVAVSEISATGIANNKYLKGDGTWAASAGGVSAVTYTGYAYSPTSTFLMIDQTVPQTVINGAPIFHNGAVVDGGSGLDVLTGQTIQVFDSTDLKWINLYHDSTDAWLLVSGGGNLQIETPGGYVQLSDGEKLQAQSNGDDKNIQFYHNDVNGIITSSDGTVSFDDDNVITEGYVATGKTDTTRGLFYAKGPSGYGYGGTLIVDTADGDSSTINNYGFMVYKSMLYIGSDIDVDTLMISGTYITATSGYFHSGYPGTDGELGIYSEQGAPDYMVKMRPNAAMTQDTTYLLPADDGDAGEQLQTDGSGGLSWEAAGGVVYAKTDLSNLAATAINTSLVSDTTATDDLGSTAVHWKNVYARNGLFNDNMAVGNLNRNIIPTTTTFYLFSENNTPGISTYGVRALTNQNPSAAGAHTGYNFVGYNILGGAAVYNAGSQYSGLYFSNRSYPTTSFFGYGSSGSANVDLWGIRTVGAQGIGGTVLTSGTTYGLEARGSSASNTCTNSYGVYIDDGTGTITNNYGLYIETIDGGGTNYQVVLSGEGAGSGIWFSGIATYGRIYASAASTLDMDIDGTTELKVTASTITLGSATADRVQFTAGDAGTAPATCSADTTPSTCRYGADTSWLATPDEWIVVKVGANTRFIPTYQ